MYISRYKANMFTISLEINLLSESSISCFSFILLDLPFLVHPSIILWLILKIKINEFRMFSAASQIVEAELFFGALYLYSIYWEWQGYSLPCLYLNFENWTQNSSLLYLYNRLQPYNHFLCKYLIICNLKHV